ncbi:MAG: sugar phosphate isomerase/epimerase [Planctomycetales bacterium]|nr:sugar phosphate isomerase/epimerase [Planctomycetales bacterium]
MPLRFAYCLNGFSEHRLGDACRLLADLGYAGVAITAGPPHLDLEALGPAGLEGVRALCERLGLARVVETGGRFWLDPREKHEPTLVSADPAGRARREAAVGRAIEAARFLGAPVVHLWSGRLRPGVAEAEAWAWLVPAVRRLADAAARAGIRLAFEPEPGMLVDRLAGWDRLRAAVGTHGPQEALGLTLDLGHVVCLEDPPWPEAVARVARDLAHVQVEDMRRGVHEHLPFGEGELPLPEMLGALERAGYGGLVSVELARHSHEAPVQAERSLAALRVAAATAQVAVAGR